VEWAARSFPAEVRPGGQGQGPQPGQPPQPGQRGPGGINGPGPQLGPPGRWWDDPSFVKSLKLRPDQQARMDAIFDENRSTLVSHLQGLQQAQAQMLDLSRSPVPDEAALLAQIDRVAQARAELQKADTRMLLEIRKEMDPDQIKRLDKAR
jgi:Spy/CpxP family protein refolding chaperone